MDKEHIINNWDTYYKSYINLNPDLLMSGIKTKRSSLNHYIKYGYQEGRKVSNTIQLVNEPPPVIQQNITKFTNLFYLTENMIIEKL